MVYYQAIETKQKGNAFKLHGHNPSGSCTDGIIRIVHESSGAVDIAKYTVMNVDLKSKDLFGDVDDSTEDSEGAYVHWNIDNDDASDNTVGGSKHPGGDYLQVSAAQVSKEDDLKPLTMTVSPCPSEGTVVLRVGSDKAKIWKAREKGGKNLVVAGVGEKSWDLADAGQRKEFKALCSALWVEGVAKGESQVTLSYVGNCSDTVKYTFIAANCGRQPRTDKLTRTFNWGGSLDYVEREFLSPGLVHCEWSILGGFNNKYNCLAWAVGMQTVWVEGVYLKNNVSTAESDPDEEGVTRYIGIDAKYGNGDGKLDDNEIDNFFLDYGYVPVASVEDADIIYYDGYHAAKRRNCGCGEGRWEMFESKCGAYFTIEHVYDKISNYGAPARYYRKQ